MTKKPLSILGLNPGTRYLGIALLQGPELRDWGVKVLKGKWSKEKMKKAIGIVARLFDRHRVNALAMKKLHPSRSSRGLNRLVAGIMEAARKRRLKVYQFPVAELEDFFAEGTILNRKKLAEAVASRYPVLFHELERERSHRNPYHLRMFEAVALGSVCFHRLDR